MLLLSPLLVVLCGLVRLFLGSPVLFRQQRPGLHERPFVIYKFRTMSDQCDAKGEQLPDGERLTRFGSFLRSTSLDELPELLNVVRGDMSLVGPRPLLMRYTPYFIDRERLRFTVLPGITGWAQINGRNESSWDDRLNDDVWYVEHRSFLLDMKILAKTAALVFKRQGVVVDARTVMLNFDEERSRRRKE